MSVNLANALTALETALGTISGLRVFKFIPDSISPPAAVVDIDGLEYDNSMGRGTDRVTFAVTVAVGKVVDRAAHAAVTTYMEGTGATSVKAAVDAIGANWRVMRVRKSIVILAAQEYLGATFEVDYVA